MSLVDVYKPHGDSFADMLLKGIIVPMKRIKLLVRRNLKMSSGKIAAQCVHAALGLNQLEADKDRCFDYLDPMLSVVVLEVSDAKFESAKKNLENNSALYLVHDAGYTEVAPDTETVLAYLEDDPREIGKLNDREGNLEENPDTIEQRTVEAAGTVK